MKVVRQYTLDGILIKEYASIKDAAVINDFDVSHLNMVVRSNESHVYRGFYWTCGTFVDTLAAKANTHGCRKTVRQYSVQDEFIAEYPTIKVAAEATGLHATGIGRAARTGGICGGYYWRVAAVSTNPAGAVSTNPAGAVSSTKVQMIDKHTNEVINVYDSINKAAESTGIAASSICRCINGKRATAGGYCWKSI